MNKLVQRSFLNALGTIAYVAVVATIMQNGEKIFGNINQTLAPIAFLTMFVLSAAVTGSLVLGKPVLMYLDNQKSDAIKLFVYTVCWLALAVVILLVSSILFK
jgi:branched-subunit amino acid permease